MTLAAGTRLGPYEILAPLGAGGMGEVYRARDSRLGRDVAIKVLPQHLSSNPEVRARFEREARTVSSLNHAHICTLFDVGRAPGEAGSGDIDYLVMELIEGETLAQRLARGPLPMAETLKLGAQIADALDRAHRAGVIHRDLKPGNVMLTRAGGKLMDFGLARGTALSSAPGSGTTFGAMTQSPTVAQPLTSEGTIVGTFQYMSPEQLEGRESDARSDIWALGCVLYEMATGHCAYQGVTQASLISSIMRDTPRPISELAPMSPVLLDRLVRQCLAKDADERIQSAHDVKLQLQALSEMPAGADTAIGSRRAEPSIRERLAWTVAALAIVAAALTMMRPHENYLATLRTTLLAPPATRLQLTGDDAGPPALSPDGTKLVFTAVGAGAGARLWLRRTDELTARPLSGTEGAMFPFWSPDGRSIAFFTSDQLKRLDLDAGSVLSIAPCNGGRGGTWSKTGVIVFAPNFMGALVRIPASGGTPVAITTLDTTRESTHRWPQFLPDGKHFIYLAARHDDPAHRSAIWCASLDHEAPRRLFDCGSNAVYASGWLLFVRDSTLLAQRFDPGSQRLEGDPVATSEIVQLDPSTWRTVLSTSDNGLLAYGIGGRASPCQLTWFDRAGHPLRLMGTPGNYFNLALSPDGSRVAIERQIAPNADLWVEDLASGTRTRVTNSPDDDSAPVWSPDGTRLAYAHRPGSDHYQLLSIRTDGVQAPVLLHADPGIDEVPFSWSRDGRFLYFGRGDYSFRAEGTLWRVSLGADRRVEPVIPSSQAVGAAALSPDGRWLAFASLASGRPELVVVAAPLGDTPPDTLTRRWQLTNEGGDKPVWRGDSRELDYVRPDGTIMALAVDGSRGEFRVLSATPLFQAFQRNFTQSFLLTPDGSHLVVSVVGSEGSGGVALVTDWQRQLERR